MRKVPLSAKYGIYISEAHSFGTDAVLLSHFAADGKKGMTACDLGTGCGIIPMLLVRANAVKKVVGVDIQSAACEQARKTAEENSVCDMFSVVEGDLKDICPPLDKAAYDLVTCNPPYKAEGAGIVSTSSADIIARHETECTLDDVCAAAKKLLRFGGRFCICQRPERLADIITAMKNCGIEPKRLRNVAQRVGKEPWLILVEGRLGGKAGMRILPTLYIEEDKGKLSPEMIEIYGDYKEGHGDGI